jgi:hypothetical protein
MSARVAPQYRQTAAKYCQPLGKLPSTRSFSEPAAPMILLQQGHRADIAISPFDRRADKRDAAVGVNWKAVILVWFGIFEWIRFGATGEPSRSLLPGGGERYPLASRPRLPPPGWRHVGALMWRA